MFKQSSSRNQKARGFKAKHALQICVLVSVCVWLLYQVKHSHDKKKAFEERITKISTVVEESSSEILRFSRKDLPHISTETKTDTETNTDNKVNEEDEETQPEVKPEESEEEVKGAGQDEIDDNDQERGDEETEHAEESHDDEEKENQSAELGLSTNHDEDNAAANSQEAREENYKGDDASSAVVRHTETTESESGNLSGNIHEEQVESMENDVEIGNKTVGTEDNLKVDDTSTNETSLLEEDHEAGSLSNSTSVVPNIQLEQESNSTEEVPLIASEETQNSSTVTHMEQENNSTVGSSFAVLEDTQNNSTVIVGAGDDSSLRLNSTIHMDMTLTTEIATSEEDHFNSTIDGGNSNSTEDGNSTSENILIEQLEKSDITNGIEGLEESSTASSNLTESATTRKEENVVHAESIDPLATEDMTVIEEEKDARTDLSTLPETQTETKIEDIAAE